MGDIIRQRVRYGGGSGSGLPDGGTTGQALVKKSDANQDVEWKDIESSIPSGWGIAKSGELQVPITNQRGDIVIPVNDLGVASGDDYNVALTIVGGGTGSWGDALTFLWDKSAARANGSVVTTGADVDRVDVSYIVVAKGYGSNVSGWGVAKIGSTGVEFSNSTWSSTSTVNISDLGLNATTDYEVFVEQVGGGTLAAWGDSTTYVGSKSKDNFTVGAVKPEAVTGTLNVKYIVFAKGYGGSGGKGEEEFFIVPINENDMTVLPSEAQETKYMTAPYTYDQLKEQVNAGKVVALSVTNKDLDIGALVTLEYNESVSGQEQFFGYHYYVSSYNAGGDAVVKMELWSLQKQTNRIYLRRYEIAGNGSSYDDTELRTMIGDVSDLQTASHELVGAINELQTGNVFPVVDPSKVTGDPLVFLRENSNADGFWLYNINGYPGNPVDMSAYVPAGANSFYLRSDLIYSKKGEPVDTRGYTAAVECFMTDDGFTSNPGQRSGVAYIQLHDGGTMTARVIYIPATGRLHMESVVQLAKQDDLLRRPVAYTLDVDEHFISPNISYGYSKTKEFLPGAQVDLEFWDPADFGPDFDVDDPTTWPTPMATYTGSVIDDDLKFTINNVVGQYNAARNVVEFDLTSFPEYDATNENGSLYIHGTMVRAMEPELVRSAILVSPNGTKYRLQVADDGTLSAEAVT